MDSAGASGMGVSTGSALTGVGVAAEEERRSSSEGSFFLCERLSVLVRRGAATAGEARDTGVAGWEETGCWGRASKSARWFAKVFWESRILRTAGVVLAWLAIHTHMLAVVRMKAGRWSVTSSWIVSRPRRYGNGHISMILPVEG